MSPDRRARWRTSSARLVLMGFATALPAGQSWAQEITGRVGLSASGGYASNPFLSADATGSGYVEGAIRPNVSVTDGLGQTNFDAYYTRKEYFREYDHADSYGASARGQRKLSERIDVRALLSYDSTIVGSSNLDSDQEVDPGIPEDPDIGLIGTRQRRRTLRSSVGMTMRPGTRDTWSIDLNALQSRYPSRTTFAQNYVSYGGQFGYSRALSETSSVGATIGYSEVDYDGVGRDARIISPQLTYTRSFADGWTVNAGLGVSIATRKLLTGDDTSTNLAANLNACRKSERASFCFGGGRSNSATGYGGVRTVTDLTASYSYRMSERGTFRANASYSLNDRNDAAEVSGKQEYLSASAGYSHRLTERLNVTADAGYRDTYGSLLSRDADIWGKIGLTFSIGDRR